MSTDINIICLHECMPFMGLFHKNICYHIRNLLCTHFLKVLWCLQIILSKKKKKLTVPSPPRLLLLPSHQLYYSWSAKNIHTFWENRRWNRDLLKYQRIVRQSKTFKKIFKSSNASEIVLLLFSHQLQYLVHPSNKLSICLSENIILEGQTLVRHTHVSQNHLPRLNYWIILCGGQR